MNAADHLGPEIQFGYRNQLLTPEELRLADAHLSTCAACRDTLARDMDVHGMAASGGPSWNPNPARAAGRLCLSPSPPLSLWLRRRRSGSACTGRHR